ncbi:hypothetical protein ANI_1_828104 [Paecilomyces variotii No. 5]|uniref:DUF7587 domain-containing protein n=1 Tax=Byssochlamys spectabilis (strain No. 5 / NBRC 109023) TaxID=1356009 RepID=V5G8V8_BYSSN|nr:hypothetical protein ANI_1_828104 [Paecilomyces variotii No. 5]
MFTAHRGKISLYRVTDDDSMVQYDEIRGFCAGDMFTRVNLFPRTKREAEETADQVIMQSNWENDILTAVMSTYSNLKEAEYYANRRVWDGKSNVRIFEMEVDERYVQCRGIRDLAKELGIWIPHKAYNHSRYEVLCEHRIPRRYITRYKQLTDKFGSKPYPTSQIGTGTSSL